MTACSLPGKVLKFINTFVLISVTENKTTKAFLVLPCLSMGERSHREGGGHCTLLSPAKRGDPKSVLATSPICIYKKLTSNEKPR